MSMRRLRDRPNVVYHAGRGLRVGGVDRLHLARSLRKRTVDLVRIDSLPPLGFEVQRAGAVRVAELGPALTELPAGGDQGRVTWSDQVRHRRFHRPRAGCSEHEHLALGLEHRAKPAQDALVDLDENGRAVIEDRLCHHLRDRWWQGRGPRRHEVVLLKDVHRCRPLSMGAAEHSEHPGAARRDPPGSPAFLARTRLYFRVKGG